MTDEAGEERGQGAKGGGGRAETGETGRGGNQQRRVYVKRGGGGDDGVPSFGTGCGSATRTFVMVEKHASRFVLHAALKNNSTVSFPSKTKQNLVKMHTQQHG